MSGAGCRAALAAFAVLGLSACDRQAAAPRPVAPPGTTLAQAVREGPDEAFAKAVGAAGLERALAAPGPFTLLVPSDAAVDQLPAGAFDGLLKPGARSELTRVVRYHVLRGQVSLGDIAALVQRGGGRAVLPTANGSGITAELRGDKVVLSDDAGTRATIVSGDERHANGVIHHLDRVLMPQR